MNTAEWLETPEGQEWSLPVSGPALSDWTRPHALAGCSPPVRLSPLDPAEDPCGRPPLGERDL